MHLISRCCALAFPVDVSAVVPAKDIQRAGYANCVSEATPRAFAHLPAITSFGPASRKTDYSWRRARVGELALRLDLLLDEDRGDRVCMTRHSAIRPPLHAASVSLSSPRKRFSAAIFCSTVARCRSTNWSTAAQELSCSSDSPNSSRTSATENPSSRARRMKPSRLRCSAS
jgi:hypothetical protein